jgi:hypothetical protein
MRGRASTTHTFPGAAPHPAAYRRTPGLPRSRAADPKRLPLPQRLKGGDQNPVLNRRPRGIDSRSFLVSSRLPDRGLAYKYIQAALKGWLDAVDPAENIHKPSSYSPDLARRYVHHTMTTADSALNHD